MNDKSAVLSRRTFLQGTGVALALPWLESFSAGSPTSDETPRRFLSVYHPDGVGLPLKSDLAWKDWSWFPRGSEKDFELTKVLDVLEPLRGDITVYSGLSHPDARHVHGHSNADQYLTGAAIGGDGPYRNTISLDQVYAEHAGDFTRHSSLVMSTNGGVGGPRGAQTQSFNREGRPIPAMNKPKEIFDMLFVTSGKDAAARLARSKSALDLLLDNSRSLERQLSSRDQETLKQYLDAVRDTELKLAKAQKSLAVGLGGAHGLTHEVKNPGGWENLGTYNRYQAEEFGRFSQRLKDTPEPTGAGNMLDNTLAMHGSASSSFHLSRNYPIISAGGKNLGFTNGRYLKFGTGNDDNQAGAGIDTDAGWQSKQEVEELPLGKLFVTILQRLGVETDSFGGQTGSLSRV